MRASFWALAASAALASMLGAAPPVAASPIVVSPSNMGNWAFDNRDGSDVIGANATATAAMVTGPGSPPLGVGSANLATGNGAVGGDGAAELRNTGYVGTLISQITALGYSTYMTQNNGQQFPYLGLTINFTGGTSVDDIFFFEPPYQTPGSGNALLPNQGATVLNQWQTWDALAGGWWDNNGMCNPGTGVDSLANCLGSFYGSAVIVNAASGLGGVRFDVGFASGTDVFNGYVDNFTVGINNVNTTYDFEPASAPVPEPSTLVIISAAVLSLLFFAMRRQAVV
jgi:hypothetical protein